MDYFFICMPSSNVGSSLFALLNVDKVLPVDFHGLFRTLWTTSDSFTLVLLHLEDFPHYISIDFKDIKSYHVA